MVSPIPDKIDGVSTLSALTEFNDLKNDIFNSITDVGQTIGGNNFQISRSMATYAARGDYFTDGGTANNYVLSAQGSMKAPISYVTGMKVRFIAGTTNLDGVSLVNVATLGNKNIKMPDGTDPRQGVIFAGNYVELVYNGTNFIFSSQSDSLVKVEENPIINSGFEFFQRLSDVLGETLTNAFAYVADRFYSSSGQGGGVCTIKQGTFAPGTTLEDADDPVYFLEHDQTTPATTGFRPAVFQRIEGVHNYAGKKITISFGALVSAGSTNYQIVVTQNFGSGGSSPIVTPGPAAALLTNTLERYEIPIDIPSISGKTVGANNYLEISVLFDFNLVYTVAFTSLMTNVGPSANYYFNKSSAKEIADCQRYYQQSYNVDVEPGTITEVGMRGTRYESGGPAVKGYENIFMVTKRVPPTIVYYNPVTGGAGTWRDYSNGANRNIISIRISDTSVYYELDNVVPAATVNGHWTADAEL
jgi:hypothetical protein